MKKKALLKDTIREIKKSFGRFISIFLIVGIGVAFYTGIKASVPIMKGSADAYFDDYNLMDIKVQSTLGLDQNDVEAIQDVKGIEGVYPSHSMDAISIKDTQQSVVKVMSIPEHSNQENKEYINQYRIVEGRMPKGDQECVIETDSVAPSGYDIGDNINLTSGNDEDIHDALKNTTYTIVGKVMTPYYLSYEKGSSTIGSGKVNQFIAIEDTNFKSSIFSEVYITVKGAKAYNSYTDVYFDLLKPIERRIKAIAGTQASLRLADVKQSAQREVDKGVEEFTANKNEFDAQIKDGKSKLASGETQFVQGRNELAQKKLDTEMTFAQTQQEISNGYETMKQLQTQYDKGMVEWEKAETAYVSEDPVTKLTQLQENHAQLTQAIQGLDESLMIPGLAEDKIIELQAKRATYLAQQQATMAGIVQLQEGKVKLDESYAQLNGLQATIITTTAQLDEGTAQLRSGRDKAQTEFKNAQVTIDKNEKELEENKNILINEENDGLAKLKEAKEKLDKAQKDIDEIAKPKWYVLNRNSHYSYMDYGGAADRMDGIAKVFPVFFYLVAALVCLTTMTRMVDEQRQEIGTLKALGYSKIYIAMKYITYAGIASIFGGIFGAIIGTIIFPTVIYSAWNIMYLLPPVRLHMEVGMSITSIAIASFVTISAAVFACYKDLMETPSLLMRPKAPKNGKKIFLEHIPFIWNHFNFIHKVTARNIFRYKKRFLMTVIGISGCTALLVAGFGVQDSINEIVTTQYGEIYNFDMSLNYKDDTTISQRHALELKMGSDRKIDKQMEISIQHGNFKDKGENKSIDLYIVEQVKEFKTFVDLRERVRQTPLTISSSGAIISEQLAKRKGVSQGDFISIDNGEGSYKKIKITGICENYVGHAMYMTNDYYNDIYGKHALSTGQLIKLKEGNTSKEESIGSNYLKEESVESVQFYSSIASSFEDTVDSLSFVVVVLIISAGLLAFVVLYNLTNVNISERLREIATIKVLGFYDREVSSYVYRENIFLTIIGAVVGLFLGIALHSLIMDLAELDNVMFGRNINIPSFVYSFFITLAFSIIVNIVMYDKLKKIPMVESLKSIE